jgi:deoxyadenosine/deoxycytidine kinase
LKDFKRLKEEYENQNNIVFLEEPVNQWEQIKDNKGNNMLQKYYENPKKYAFSFQMMAFITRRNLIRDTIAKYDGCKVIIMERSLEADRKIFVNMLQKDGLLESTDVSIYDMISKDDLEKYGVDGVIWLATEPEECRRRIEKRGRDGEEAITMEYLENLDLWHKEWLDGSTKNEEKYKICKMFDNTDLTMIEQIFHKENIM